MRPPGTGGPRPPQPPGPAGPRPPGPQPPQLPGPRHPVPPLGPSPPGPRPPGSAGPKRLTTVNIWLMQILSILLLYPDLTVGLPSKDGLAPKNMEHGRDKITTLREARELGLWQMSTTRLARSTTPASPANLIKVPPDVPTPQHFPKATFLVPFGRKLSKKSPNLQLKDVTVDLLKTSNIRKRNFNTVPSSVLADWGSTNEFFGRRETGVRRGQIDQVRGRDKVSRGRVRIKGALLKQIQARRDKEEQKIPRKNELLVSARPSRLRIRNINLRRNVTTTIKSFSPKVIEVVETSSPKTLLYTNGHSVKTNELTKTSENQHISATTMRSSPATTAKQVAEKIFRNIETLDLEITSLKKMDKKHQKIWRPSVPAAHLEITANSTTQRHITNNDVSTTTSSSTTSISITTTAKTTETTTAKTTETTTTGKTTKTTTTAKTTRATTTPRSTTESITTSVPTSTTTIKLSTTTTVTSTTTPRTLSVSTTSQTKLTYPTSNLKLLSDKNKSVSKLPSSLDEQNKPANQFPNQNHKISKSEPFRARAELKKDLLEAIRRKISKNRLVQAEKESKNEMLNHTDEPMSPNLQMRITNGPSFAAKNLVSSTKPPFFRPISFPLRRDNSSAGRNIAQAKVKIFVNLPNTKPGSIVKIPNVSHIQDKLARLNAAINEGLKIQQQKKEQEAREKEIADQIKKTKNDKLQKLSHPTTTTTTTFMTTKSTPTTKTNYTKTSSSPIIKPFKTGVTTEKLIIVNYFEKLRKETTKKSRQKILTTVKPVSMTTSKLKKSHKFHHSYVEHPSSHFRPKNNSQLYPMPKSTMEHNSPVFIVTPKYGTFQPRKNITLSSNVTGSEKKVDKEDSLVIENITGTTVYVVGVIAIIPAAGILAWLVRFVIKRKELSSSESSSETGLHQPITEDDSLQVSGRHSQILSQSCFETIAEGPENIPKVDNVDAGASLWQFPRSRLRLQTVLGEGNFGKVWKAEADDICGYDGTILVAVKTVKENSSQREVEDLIEEMKIMQEIGPHANVVTILGVCSEQEPYWLIMEYVMYGKLLTHLREQRSRQSSFFNFSKDGAEVGETLTSKDLTKFAYGVAKGMEFLVTKGVIHRDLAARNILVDHNKNTKISDFGLSRNLRDLGGEMYEQKTKGALPIRWMAPESLYFSVFTSKSDVWGFGILMWEIVTLGSTPYPGMGAREVMRRVRDGYRLERPAHCHPELYLIIQKCWAGDMNKRPDFSELRKELAKLLEDQHGYIDLQNIAENYYSMDQNPDEEEKL